MGVRRSPELHHNSSTSQGRRSFHLGSPDTCGAQRHKSPAPRPSKPFQRVFSSGKHSCGLDSCVKAQKIKPRAPQTTNSIYSSPPGACLGGLDGEKEGKSPPAPSAHESREGKAAAGHLSCPLAEQIHSPFRVYCLSQYQSFPCPNPEAFAARCSESERIYHLCCPGLAGRATLGIPGTDGQRSFSIHGPGAERRIFCELGTAQLGRAGLAKEGGSGGIPAFVRLPEWKGSFLALSSASGGIFWAPGPAGISVMPVLPLGQS